MQRSQRPTVSVFNNASAQWILLGGVCLFATPAHAYIGPAAGIGAIGSLVAVIGAVAFAIIGLIWYPLKRLWRSFRRDDR